MASGLQFFFIIGMQMLIAGGNTTQENAKTEEVTLYGEIIDSKCYIEKIDAGRGLEHRECAVKCAKSGIPLAFLEEKTEKVYFLARLNKPGGVNEMLMPFIAERVAVTGKISERGGASMIMLDMVEKMGE